ncbi:O-antigen ligase family protein [Stanieria cyanosphaera]|nr:O-antigen ligase family protein [Stanieria cyanosphaera]
MATITSQGSTISLAKIFGLFTVCFYVLFTLLADSHSLMVLYPVVLLWQIGLMLPILWLLMLVWQGKKLALGNHLDWLVGLGLIAVVISTVFAQFKSQAIWYGWAAFGLIAVIYLVNYYGATPQNRFRFLVKQGYLNLALIIVSLCLWFTQTLLPELARLQQLKQSGINLAFDFSTIELRNWSPFGHQNYVAGYLVLALPLLIGLTILATDWRRWLWLSGCILGLLDLYTTSSRGGWLAVIATFVIGLLILLCFSPLPRLWLVLGGIGSLIGLSLVILANNRFNNLIMAVIKGQGGSELAYRTINAVIGWRMGISHLWTGVGLGNVALLYQRYRPTWAGRESELAFQLHSTPVQLWAEIGIWSVVLEVGTSAFLGFFLFKLLREGNNLVTSDRILSWCLYASLFAYGVMSLTDYQLDNMAISGTLVLFGGILAAIWRSNSSWQRQLKKVQSSLSLVGLGITLAVIIWLFPVHRAWQLSSQGFMALNQGDKNTFIEKLTKANQLAPWEPYYSAQLGWNLGEFALASSNVEEKQQLSLAAIEWLQKSITASPYSEFGYSNLGWLVLNSNPSAATQAFVKSAELIPAKRGVFYGLGVSLLVQRQIDLATEAFTLEILRDPVFVTSPVWQSPLLRQIYPLVLNRLETKYSELIKQNSDNSFWHLCRGSLYWWEGNLAAAKQDWQPLANPLTEILLEIDSDSELKAKINALPKSSTQLLLKAWFEPENRPQLLQQAWLLHKDHMPSSLHQELLISMAQANSLREWLIIKNPIIPYRRERSGFGVVSRHIDGTIPNDFLVVVDHIAIATWFESIFPSPIYFPDLDRILQTQRDTLLKTILASK